MKKFLTFSILIINLLLCSACGSDDKDEVVVQNLLIGTWDMEPNEYGDIYEMVFMENGRFIDNVIIDKQIDDIFEGTYVIKENIVTKNYLTHKERKGKSNQWLEGVVEEGNKTFRFNIEGDKLTISSLNGTEKTILTRKKE